MKRFCVVFLGAIAVLCCLAPSTIHAASRRVVPTPTPATAVIPFAIRHADEAAKMIARFYPNAHVVVDRRANALIVSAAPDDINAIRTIAGGIDSKSALAPVNQPIVLHRLDADDVADRLRSLFPDARLSTIGHHTLLVSANNTELQQIQALVSAVDASPATPTPPTLATPAPTKAVHVYQAPAKQVAREVAGAIHGLRVSVAGQAVVLAGDPELISRAEDIIEVLDSPTAATPYTAVYRIKTLDAKSVADLLQRSFPNAKINVDEDINSLTVYATSAEQRRISDGIAQIDTAGPQPGSGTGNSGAVSAGGAPAEIYQLKYALPGQNGAPSTSASDLASMVSQTLASQAPDLHVSAAPDNTQLILTGSPYSMKLARDLIAGLDVPQKLVVLDTEILEMDENTAKNLGLQLSSIAGGGFAFGTVYSEVQPTPNPISGVTPPLKQLQPLTRTGIGFIAVLNLAIQNGTARVLADPRITTLSGHTATIRAGDNISIQLQTGGGPGTIATTQIQTFQTGVTLDITPIVNDGGLITVGLHPVVNSLTGVLNGIPQISTRDTQTTVALKQNQTLVIGGLIEDNTERSESKIPLLGDLPLVGRVFRNETLNGSRNELIISVTPHIASPGETTVYPGPPLPTIPTPAPLPTLPPGATLPNKAIAAVAVTPAPIMVSPPPRALPLITPSPPAITLSPATASPAPAASRGSTDAFVFGSPPPTNVAGPSDPPKIFYATVSPTHVSYGSAVQINATTSTNVSQLTLNYNGISTSIPQVGTGTFAATFPFTYGGMGGSAATIQLTLIASKTDGTSTSIPISLVVGSPTQSAAGHSRVRVQFRSATYRQRLRSANGFFSSSRLRRQ